ncbi:MAG: hypothetical protein IT327_09190 [Anaerolineae bacterium]|nr:hypothetical protein [Anaerolineae bacterium]
MRLKCGGGERPYFPPFYGVQERYMVGNGRCQREPVVAKVWGWGTAVFPPFYSVKERVVGWETAVTSKNRLWLKCGGGERPTAAGWGRNGCYSADARLRMTKQVARQDAV